MKRRDLIKCGFVAATMNVSTELKGKAMQLSSNIKPKYYALTSFETRNDFQPNKQIEFLQNYYVPTLKKYGLQNIGAFRGQTGFTTPGILLISEYPSLVDYQIIQEKLSTDQIYQKALREHEGKAELPYLRLQCSLLKAFSNHPMMEIPKELSEENGKQSSRLFEFRTYESRTTLSLTKKIEMFNLEEIQIFRDSNFTPIFFGETVFGANMPSLSYMVAFDNMAERDNAWSKFSSSAAFTRIKTKPGWTDPEAVSNIKSCFLRALPFSSIK